MKTLIECASATVSFTKIRNGQPQQALSSFVYNSTQGSCEMGILPPIPEFATIPLGSTSKSGLYVRRDCLPTGTR